MKLFRNLIILLALLTMQACAEEEYYNFEFPDDNVVDLNGAVDLGLSVKWAASDLGARLPYVSGDDVDMPDGDGNICGTELDPVTQALGKPWRLPSRQEFEELLNNCKWRYGEFHNAIGWFVTGPSGKTIFLKSGTRWSGYSYAKYYYYTLHVPKNTGDSPYVDTDYYGSIFEARPVCD